MAETKYSYTISTQTASNKVSPHLLTQEIEDSSIVENVNYLWFDMEADVLDIYMANALSGGDQTTLTSVVSSHNPPSVLKVKGNGSDASEFQTQSQSFQVKYSKLFSDLGGGTYQIVYSSELKGSTTNKNIIGAIFIDGSQVIQKSVWDDTYQSFAGELTHVFLPGNHTIDFKVKSAKSKVTAYMKNCTLEIKRIGE